MKKLSSGPPARRGMEGKKIGIRFLFPILRFARSHALFACSLIFHFSFSPLAHAEEPPAKAEHVAPALPANLDISSQVDRSEISIGDRIQYEIKVVYPAEGRVELPSVLGNLGSFEVKDFETSEPKLAGKLKIQTWRFVLSTFTVGTYMIPPQTVAYLPPGAVLPTAADPAAEPDTNAAAAPGGPQPLIFYTQPIEIKVVRTSPETVQDIADIAPLAVVPSATPWLAIALGGALLLGLLGWFLLRRKSKVAEARAEKPQLPPFEEAMERLATLNPGALIRANRARELCFDLSEVLRRYISRRFDVDALESTTTEFLALVPKLPITAAQRQWIGRFCEATDIVKFAGMPILESEAADLVSGLQDFLRQTRPREDAVKSRETAGGSAANKKPGDPKAGRKTGAA